MTTTTKFNIGDEVFFLYKNRVETGKVIIIEVKVQAGAHQVVDTLDFLRDGGIPLRFEDEYLFHSKKELLESL